jgi:hypothetical protein
MNKKQAIEFLRTKRIITGVPTVVKFRVLEGGKMRSFKAKKGTWVVKWNDVLKAFRELNNTGGKNGSTRQA